MPRPLRGMTSCRQGGGIGASTYYLYFKLKYKPRPLPPVAYTCTVSIFASSQHMSESGGSTRAPSRVRGVPNKELYDKAQKKYKTYDRSAKTEYERLQTINSTKPFTTTGNPNEFAIFYHLTQLKGAHHCKIKCIDFVLRCLSLTCAQCHFFSSGT